MFTSEKMVKFLREKYPPGTRIRLVSMEDPYAPVAPGTEGTLVCVDDAGHNAEFSIMLLFIKKPPAFNNF